MWTLWEIDWTERRLKRSVSFYYSLTLFIHKHCRIHCANNNQLYPRFLYYKLTLPLVVCRLNEFNQILIIVFDNFLTRQISQVFLHFLFFRQRQWKHHETRKIKNYALYCVIGHIWRHVQNVEHVLVWSVWRDQRTWPISRWVGFVHSFLVAVVIHKKRDRELILNFWF